MIPLLQNECDGYKSSLREIFSNNNCLERVPVRQGYFIKLKAYPFFKTWKKNLFYLHIRNRATILSITPHLFLQHWWILIWNWNFCKSTCRNSIFYSFQVDWYSYVFLVSSTVSIRGHTKASYDPLRVQFCRINSQLMTWAIHKNNACWEVICKCVDGQVKKEAVNK